MWIERKSYSKCFELFLCVRGVKEVSWIRIEFGTGQLLLAFRISPLFPSGRNKLSVLCIFWTVYIFSLVAIGVNHCSAGVIRQKRSTFVMDLFCDESFLAFSLLVAVYTTNTVTSKLFGTICLRGKDTESRLSGIFNHSRTSRNYDFLLRFRSFRTSRSRSMSWLLEELKSWPVDLHVAEKPGPRSTAFTVNTRM